jgi:hypothetical protein
MRSIDDYAYVGLHCGVNCVLFNILFPLVGFDHCVSTNWKDGQTGRIFSIRRQPEVIRVNNKFVLLFFFVNLFPKFIVGVAQLIPCDFSIFQSYRRAHDSQFGDR